MKSNQNHQNVKPVVSDTALAAILTSPRLRTLLLPEGTHTSPYEVLDYTATLTLHDPKGLRATFARRQRVRFLQDGVAGLLDHVWGDGVPFTDYQHDAGSLIDRVRDGDTRHLVIGLPAAMRRDDTLTFSVTRQAMAAFTTTDEWLETTVDHPIRRLTCVVLFPAGRPCHHALLDYGQKRTLALPVYRLHDGRTVLQLRIATPKAHRPYLLRWHW